MGIPTTCSFWMYSSTAFMNGAKVRWRLELYRLKDENGDGILARGSSRYSMHSGSITNRQTWRSNSHLCREKPILGDHIGKLTPILVWKPAKKSPSLPGQRGPAAPIDTLARTSTELMYWPAIKSTRSKHQTRFSSRVRLTPYPLPHLSPRQMIKWGSITAHQSNRTRGLVRRPLMSKVSALLTSRPAKNSPPQSSQFPSPAPFISAARKSWLSQHWNLSPLKSKNIAHRWREKTVWWYPPALTPSGKFSHHLLPQF